MPSPNGGEAAGATGDEAKCPICGKAFDGHKNVIPPPSTQSDKAAKDVLKPDKPRKQWTKKQQKHSGDHMVSALVIDCESSGASVFTAGAGSKANSITVDNFATKAVNVHNGQPLGDLRRQGVVSPRPGLQGVTHGDDQPRQQLRAALHHLQIRGHGEHEYIASVLREVHEWEDIGI